MATHHTFLSDAQFVQSNLPYSFVAPNEATECDLVAVSQEGGFVPTFAVLSGWNLDTCDLYPTSSSSSSSSYSSFCAPYKENTRFYTLDGALQPTTCFPESSQRTNASSRTDPTPSSRDVRVYDSQNNDNNSRLHRDNTILPKHDENKAAGFYPEPESGVRDASATFSRDPRLRPETVRDRHSDQGAPSGASHGQMMAVFSANEFPDGQEPNPSSQLTEPLNPLLLTLRLAPDSIDAIDDAQAEHGTANETTKEESDYESDFHNMYPASHELVLVGSAVPGGSQAISSSHHANRIDGGHLSDGLAGPSNHGSTDQTSPAWSYRETDSEFESDHVEQQPASFHGSEHFSPASHPIDDALPFPKPKRRARQTRSDEETGTVRGKPPKKVKMHQCQICNKSFPRPSGLSTHMNSHSGARPYACPLETCTKTFAVRSNARRHLRTHGITSGSSSTRTTVKPEPPFEVSFDTPLVASPSTALDMHFQRPRSGKKPRVPASLTTRKNAARLRSLSPGSDMADLDADMDDEEDGEYQYKYQYYRPPGPAKKVPVPLPPVKPSEPSEDPDEKFEERDSSAEAGTFPYHPEQWRRLPGPALIVPLRG